MSDGQKEASCELYRTISSSFIEDFTNQVISSTLDGWVLIKDSAYLGLYGGFTADFVRSDLTILAMKEKTAVVDVRPKMTAHERLAKARAAIGKKKD